MTWPFASLEERLDVALAGRDSLQPYVLCNSRMMLCARERGGDDLVVVLSNISSDVVGEGLALKRALLKLPAVQEVWR